MKIGIVTTTRAEYGLLKNLIQKMTDDDSINFKLIVTGTHLLSEYGNTVQYIEDDGFKDFITIPVDINTNDSASISKTMGNYFSSFSGVFESLKLDFVIVLGDRYELIPICFCAINAHTPIAHISGGEITQGAIDDSIRHCITKLSYLHFPACDEYRNRIIQLGENPNRVFNVGDPGVENIHTMNLLTETKIREKYNLSNNYFVVTFHPTTLDDIEPKEQVLALLNSISNFNEYEFIILKSNADVGGMQINEIISQFVAEHVNCHLYSSLKIEEFLALQKYSCGLIGNSSSGIVETPCFGIPTINIGDRQKGRLMASSIISCSANTNDIINSIHKALSSEFRMIARNTINPYGAGNTSDEIIKYIKQFINSNNINLKKRFFDLKG